MECLRDIRGFLEQRGGIPLLPVIRVGDDVLNDRKGADIVGHAPYNGHLHGGDHFAVFLCDQDIVVVVVFIFSQEFFPDRHILFFLRRVFGQVFKIENFQRFSVFRCCFTNDHKPPRFFRLRNDLDGKHNGFPAVRALVRTVPQVAAPPEGIDEGIKCVHGDHAHIVAVFLIQAAAFEADHVTDFVFRAMTFNDCHFDFVVRVAHQYYLQRNEGRYRGLRLSVTRELE